MVFPTMVIATYSARRDHAQIEPAGPLSIFIVDEDGNPGSQGVATIASPANGVAVVGPVRQDD